MKTTVLSMMVAVLLVAVSHHQMYAQQAQQKAAYDDYDQNIAKMNVLALPFRNFSLQYERVVARKISVSLGVGIIPGGKLPMLSAFESYIDDEATMEQLQGVRLNNQTFTLEPRFYLGKHDGPRGFYIAPYARYSTYGLSFDEFEYTVELEHEGHYIEETRTIPLDGHIRGFTGGLQFGAQWRIGRWVYLDWWILGGAYGTAKGKLTATAALSAEEQSALREELADLEIPMVDTDVDVDGNGARLNMKGPWAGVRSGLAVGVRF